MLAVAAVNQLRLLMRFAVQCLHQAHFLVHRENLSALACARTAQHCDTFAPLPGAGVLRAHSIEQEARGKPADPGVLFCCLSTLLANRRLAESAAKSIRCGRQ